MVFALASLAGITPAQATYQDEMLAAINETIQDTQALESSNLYGPITCGVHPQDLQHSPSDWWGQGVGTPLRSVDFIEFGSFDTIDAEGVCNDLNANGPFSMSISITLSYKATPNSAWVDFVVLPSCTATSTGAGSTQVAAIANPGSSSNGTICDKFRFVYDDDDAPSTAFLRRAQIRVIATRPGTDPTNVARYTLPWDPDPAKHATDQGVF